jgi:hypothetical protein
MRGLFGQSEGNEWRGQAEQFAERLLDNEVAEGHHVAVLRRIVKERAWVQVESYTARLKKEGHWRARIESMLTRAMVGLKL